MQEEFRNNQLSCAAFASALSVAFRDSTARAAYQEQTGNIAYVPPASALDQKIDDATGRARNEIKSFAGWFAKERWGESDAPDLELIFS